MSDIDLKQFADKTTEELKDIWRNQNDYVAEMVAAVQSELSRRGVDVADPPPKKKDTEKKVIDIKKELISWGYGLIIIGIISIVLADFLDPIWGGILIVLGILTLIIQQRGMFIVIGIGLLLAGIMNIIGGEFGGWTVFGFFQLYWGAQEISKFWKYASI